MTDTTSSLPPQPLPSNPPAGVGHSAVFALQVNFLAFCVAIALTIAGIKLSSLLPGVMYFSFSRAIDTAKNPSPFLIQPSHLTKDEVCKALAKNAELKSLGCDAPVETPDEAGAKAAEDDVDHLADRYIREQAQKADFLRGIFGLVIRLTIPCLAGFLVVRLFGAQEIAAGALGSGAAALLMCWPVIVLWDYVVTKEWRDFYAQFLALYVLYIIMFFYMGRLGGTIGAAVRAPRFTLNYAKVVETVTITVVAGVLTKFLEATLIVPRK